MRRIEYTTDQADVSGSTATASVYNNAWYSTPIPRSDLQYSWLTASFDSYPAKAETYGYAPDCEQDYRVGMVYAVYPDQKVIEFCTCFKTPCSDSSNRLQDTITVK